MKVILLAMRQYSAETTKLGFLPPHSLSTRGISTIESRYLFKCRMTDTTPVIMNVYHSDQESYSIFDAGSHGILLESNLLHDSACGQSA